MKNAKPGNRDHLGYSRSSSCGLSSQGRHPLRRRCQALGIPLRTAAQPTTITMLCSLPCFIPLCLKGPPAASGKMQRKALAGPDHIPRPSREQALLECSLRRTPLRTPGDPGHPEHHGTWAGPVMRTTLLLRNGSPKAACLLLLSSEP